MLNAVLDGELDNVEFRKDKIFNFDIPLTCPNVPADVLDPSNAWGNKEEYWMKYDALASRYIENFKAFTDGCPDEIINSGPKRNR
jgi:phosphoenolpyruvate carboxykinase (ATP)